MLELHTGDLIADRFRVEALLGEGGIARVYKVRHVRLGSVHAVKILTLHRPALADRLLLEGRIQAQLRHPNLVRVTDVVEHAGNPCLVMEYIDGTHLQALLVERGPLPVETALELFSSVLSAVAAAHDQGVLHRDLKPANILLESTHRGLVPKVSDFGIAKVASEGLREGQTRVGVQMGTPGYMAPEQIEDSAQVDHRADIFALGAILYEMLCGSRPFAEDTTFRTMQATLAGRYPPVRECQPHCPPAVAAAIEVALAVPMEERFPDCHAFADALLADFPALRARVERGGAAALPEGLQRPEITQASPSATTPAGPRSQPTLVAPDTALPDAGAGRAPETPGASAAAAPLLAARDRDPGSIGVGTGSGVEPSSLAAARLSPATRDEAARRPTLAIQIDAEGPDAGDPDAEGADELDEDAPARRRGALPWLAAAAALVALGVGGWAVLGGDRGALEVEELAPTAAAGEAVAPPPAEGAAGTAGEGADATGDLPPSGEAGAASGGSDGVAGGAPGTRVEADAGRTAASAASTGTGASAPGSRADATAGRRDDARPDDARPDDARPDDARTDDARAAGDADAARTAATGGGEAAAQGATGGGEAAVADASTRGASEAGEVAPADPPAPTGEGSQASAAGGASEPAVATAAGGEEPTEEPIDDGLVVAIAPTGGGAEAAPAPEAPPERAPPAVVGTWSGSANANPLTIRIVSQDGQRVVGELRFTQGAIERVARVSGTVDPANNRLVLVEDGGAGLRFTGVVRGTGMMGTYGRQGKDEALSWTATRQ